MNDLLNIKKFLDGKNVDDDKYKYIVNVEADPRNNYAECVIHEPNQHPVIKNLDYTPFIFVKDLEKHGIKLYEGQPDYVEEESLKGYGISVKKLETGNQERLENGYVYLYTSSVSLNAIHNYFRDGGLNRYEKLRDDGGNIIKDEKGRAIMPNKDFFFSPTPIEQFFISTGSRLYNGFEDYNDVHKLIFDIETDGLNYQTSRVFAIGIKDNRGLEVALTAKKLEDDESEKDLIIRFFNAITKIQPAIIAGYNSEWFDFEFILGRAALLGLDIDSIRTTLSYGHKLKRRKNTSVKYGNTPERYTSTNIWGISVIDIIHAVKRTAAINSDIKEFKLKYIAKLEEIAKPNRTYIKGDDNSIYNFYADNQTFVCDENNNYLQIPDEYQEIGRKLYLLQENKKQNKINEEDYKKHRNTILKNNKDFVQWFKEVAMPKKYDRFISGKRLTKQYLIDDLWETEQIDNLYNQSSFMLAKIVPTSYHRICTMGTAGVWNLLMATWSFENNIAVPYTENKSDFSGGLARTFKIGYAENWSKIDFASLYPMLQLSYDIFPIFDITGVIKQMLLYLTTTRNIYKKLASGSEINESEVELMRLIDHETYTKYVNNEITSKDKAKFKIKQLPIKILNNSLFGALGSGIAFNWSDSVSASKITCLGRLYLRQTIKWFADYGCIPLLAVTDGINFVIPSTSNIKITDNERVELDEEKNIEEVWNFNNKTGIDALIEYFNTTELSQNYTGKKSFMSVDNDGNFVSCYNLARINYASKSVVKDKKTGEVVKDKNTGEVKTKIKLTGNTIKSKTMPEYIEKFIDKGLDLILKGDGVGFVNYYQDYAQKIYYNQIPLKEIATKNKIKMSIKEYLNRGKDKNGREKGKQAHMELIIEEREKIIEELYEKHKDELFSLKDPKELTIEDKLKLVDKYMPPEPEKDTYVYQVNCGYKKSHGDSNRIVDEKTGKERFVSRLISSKDIEENPDMVGEYNTLKYLDAFNKRAKALLVGFDKDVAERIIVKEKIKKHKGVDGKVKKTPELVIESFTEKELELKYFELDSIDDAMYLDAKEIDFWNKTGYDPRLVWDGFKVPDNYPIHYDIYKFKLDYLNEKMKEANKPFIKSVNDNINKGDLVLFKNDDEYSIGKHNGTYIQIIRILEDLPLCETEIKLQKEKEEERKKTEKLSVTNVEETDKEKENKLKLKYFDEFKKSNGLPDELKMVELFNEYPETEEIFDVFINEKENPVSYNEFDEYEYD
ncbi:MAG: 3'-5' exonuclease [bacterium]